MILIESMLIVFVSAPIIVNCFRGKQYFTFKRRFYKSRPLLTYCIGIQLFLLILNIALEYQYHPGYGSTIISLFIVFIIFVILMIYELVWVKEGVYEGGIILRGLMCEWSKVGGYDVEYHDEDTMVIRIKLKSGKKSKVQVRVDLDIGREMTKVIDKMINE